jgi:RND superfamily putative drug exporter
MDLRAVTQKDFHRVAALALAVILLIVLALLRDWLLALFMVAATVLSYLATLGLTDLVFSMLGRGGLDWKIEVFLFIVMVAVGQDYNIFFAVRLAQEVRRLPALEATERTLIHTGPVISSCGVIMAASLGSVMVGDVTLLVQLGFALMLGMLIDTFIVRPLLLPAFIVLTRRKLQTAAAFLG